MNVVYQTFMLYIRHSHAAVDQNDHIVIKNKAEIDIESLT